MTTTRARSTRDGFTMIPDWFVESSEIALHDYAVLIVLMKHARSTGQCHPGFATIAAQARISRDSVKRALRSLEERGLIEIERRRVGTKNLPNLYTLHIERARVGAHSTHPADERSSEVGAESTQVGADSTQGWVQRAPLTRLSNETHERDKAHRFASRADDDVEATKSTRAATASQRRFIDDLRSLLDIDDDVIVDSIDDAHDLIRDYWQQIEHRRSRDESLHGRLDDLSPASQRYVREHGLLLDNSERSAS
ncbi:helix-turn-helix domain-containing protein [Microbacterium sp. bgisy189]|uniref:helix-turn-helix domain-containing protein n=1 Tax=Microbacterium sp. bgisy189 TaxID=3413798 RepID=UPI003EBEC6BF